MDAVDGIHFHRGFMHSILFFVIASPFFGWLIHKIYKGRFATRREWTIFSFWVLLTHSLLDCFTSWGTQLFYPIDYHVALNTIFIVDPLYTIPFLVLIVILMFHKKESPTRRRLCHAGLIVSSAYLLLTVINKFIVNSAFEDALAKQKIEYTRYSTKPTPLNSILWSIMVESKDGYYLGYYSLFDDNHDIDFLYIPGNHELLSEVPQDKKLKTLLHITDGYYCLEKKDDCSSTTSASARQRTWQREKEILSSHFI
jgi:inner membrane protein